jgi:hypothetical protein
MLKPMQSCEALKALLTGKAYVRFSVGAVFDLDFDGFVLSSQALFAVDEVYINDVFVQHYSAAEGTADPEDIARSAILAACRQRNIVAVETNEDASLVLRFENGVALRLPTDTPVVDWHWAVTEDARDPYLGCMFACFSPGEIQGGIANNSFKPTPQSGAA